MNSPKKKKNMGSLMKIKNYSHFYFYMLLQWENGKMAIFDTKNILPEKTTVNFHFIFTQNIVLLSYYIFMKKNIGDRSNFFIKLLFYEKISVNFTYFDTNNNTFHIYSPLSHILIGGYHKLSSFTIYQLHDFEGLF